MFNVPMIRKNRIDQLLRLDNWFDEFFKAPFRLGFTGLETVPAVDIYEQGDKITVRAEVPGARPEQLHISLDEDLLTISGEKKQEKEVKEKDYYRLEAAYGHFERTVRLPEAVQAEGAKATYKNGVLKIELPRSNQSRRKKINIEVN